MANDAPRKPATPRPPASKSRASVPKAKSPLGKIVGVLVIAGLSTGAFLMARTYRSSPFLKTYLPRMLTPQTAADVFPGQPAINLMVIGRDYDYTDSDQIMKSHARSDLLMAARVDFTRRTVALLSIPRDTDAVIPGHGHHKINSAHAWGGPPLTARTLQRNFGIAPDKYVAIDFAGFEKAIDILGGVDLTVDKKMDYDDNWGHLHIHLRPGYQHLNGQKAMGYVRFRHSDSDLVRVQRQQALLAAIKAKLRDPREFPKVVALLDTLNQHMDSDLSTDQRVFLAKFVQGIPRDQIRMATLPSRENGNLVETDWSQADPMIQSIFGVTPPRDADDDGDGASTSRHHRRRRHRAVRLAERPSGSSITVADPASRRREPATSLP